MSRRAKILITALFLVLLGIPTVYIAMTWTAPKNPLRFRVEEVIGMEKEKERDGWVQARFRVENITDVPVCLMWAKAPTGSGSGNVFCEIKHPAPFGKGWHLVPARHSIECIGDLNIYRARKKKFRDGTEMEYIWASKTKVAGPKVIRWFKERAPLRFRFKAFWPTHHTDKTILQPPAHIP